MGSKRARGSKARATLNSESPSEDLRICINDGCFTDCLILYSQFISLVTIGCCFTPKPPIFHYKTRSSSEHCVDHCVDLACAVWRRYFGGVWVRFGRRKKLERRYENNISNQKKCENRIKNRVLHLCFWHKCNLTS